jgi:hypothetical protein
MANQIRAFGLRQIDPTGKSLLIFRNRVKPQNQKYFASRLTQISSISKTVPSPLEGRIAIVTDVGDGMRWTRERQAREAIAGRDEPRERWAARRMIGAFAYGEAVWFWHPLLVSSSRRQSRPNRAGKTLIRGRRWQNELVAGESAE